MVFVQLKKSTWTLTKLLNVHTFNHNTALFSFWHQCSTTAKQNSFLRAQRKIIKVLFLSLSSQTKEHPSQPKPKLLPLFRPSSTADKVIFSRKLAQIHTPDFFLFLCNTQKEREIFVTSDKRQSPSRKGDSSASSTQNCSLPSLFLTKIDLLLFSFVKRNNQQSLPYIFSLSG